MIRHIEFAGLHNFRDVGGYITKEGRMVRWRRLYRADSLGALNGDDLDRFHELGIRTIIDLRHPEEADKHGRVPTHESYRYHNLSVEHRRWDSAVYDPEQSLGRFFADRYHEVAVDGLVELGDALRVIADGDNAPVVMHCAAGKDRTGILTALVLTLLGVPEEDVIADYALTDRATQRFIADWRARNNGADPLWPGFGRAPADAMRLFLTELCGIHGSVESYCRDALDLDEDIVLRLRAHLLGDPVDRIGPSPTDA